MTPLRQRMIEDLRIRNYAPRTIEVYVRCVAAFARYFNRSPEVLGLPEVRQYQVHLIEERRVSWPVFNQTVCALRFLYKVTLGKPWPVEHLPYARKPKRLPVVLSVPEVAASPPENSRPRPSRRSASASRRKELRASGLRPRSERAPLRLRFRVLLYALEPCRIETAIPTSSTVIT